MSIRRLEEWDGSAREYDSFEKTWHFYGTVADAMLRLLAMEEGSRVLELACGTGACTLKLAKIARKGGVTALDFSEGMLNVARENAAAAGVTNVSFVHGDARDASALLAGQAFDFAVCNSAFWHFPEPERVLVGLRQLLTAPGELALSLPSWVGRGGEAREAFRAKAREVLVKRGVPPEEIEKVFALRRRERLDPAKLLHECGLEAREVSFEFKVSRESRAAWRRIAIFSGNRQWPWLFPGLDDATRREVSEELDEWRRANFPRDDSTSKWRIFVARRPAGAGRA